MSYSKIFHKTLAVALLIALLIAPVQGQDSKLGQVDFPTSGGAEAQAHFLRGLAALHSFWFEEALDEFRASTRIEPDFMMGYWGEAMAYNHPLWAEQDTEAGRRTVARIKDTPKLTERERAYLNALKVLYGPGEKLARDIAYSQAMRKLYREYPDDLEAATFFSLSLLGTVRPGDKGFRRQMEAGAVALEVYRKNPNHPGAAHFVIHSFDDPEHAILALPAAYRYAEIAPEAHHARHMPAHIFLQLGMWPEAAKSNESAWAVSDAWVKRKKLALTARDYHSLHWLVYVYLQQGRYGKAEEIISMMRKTVTESGAGSIRSYPEVVAHFIVETDRWDRASDLFKLPEAKSTAEETGEHAHGAAQPPAAMSQARRGRGQGLPLFVRGLAAAKNAPGEVEKIVGEMRALSQQASGAGDAYGANASRLADIRELEIAAVASAAKGDFGTAIDTMKRATAIEEDMSPPSGPPDMIKPTHELFGEILLRAGKPKDAAQQFATALLRQPNRARSLLGAARAAAASGDTKAASEAYSAFLKQWQQADPGQPELREARDYLKQASAR